MNAVVKRLFPFILSIAILSGVLTSVALADNDVPYAAEPLPPDISVLSQEEFDSVVNSVLEEKGFAGSELISIGFEYTKTGETAYYNGDAWYYTASLFKLPLGMMLAHDNMNGEAPTGTFGGGVDNIEREMLVNSANKVSYTLAADYYGWDRVRENEKALSGWSEDELPEGFMKATDFQEYSCPFITDILEELYFNSDQYPGVIELLCEASPDKYLKGNDLEIPIAQKYGSYSENDLIVNHIAGIVFTDNPILITVLSKNIGCITLRALCGKLCTALVSYTSDLDSSYAEQLRSYEESLVREPEVTPEPEPVSEPSPEVSEAVSEPDIAEPSAAISPAVYTAVGAAVVIIGASIVFIAKKTKHLPK